MKIKLTLYFLLMVCCLFPDHAFAQTRTVTGRVTDDAGQGLPGVSVVLKGSSLGVTTDVTGSYSLTLPDGNGTLVFSYIGFTAKEVQVNNQAVLNATLAQDTKDLNEVVVVGYGTQRKVNLTGAVGAIEAKDLENRPIANISQGLQGRVAGLLVTQNGGQPGTDNVGLRIRGTSTFTNNDPLVIVDGIAMSLANLNPNDIESISVLKDAAASAIYGARASGGVILVTTKKGTQGQTRLTYDGYYGMQSLTRLPSMLNAYDHARLYREGELNDDPNRTTFQFSEEDIEKYRTGELPSADRLGYLFNPAPQTQHNVGISGGTESYNYYVSLGYLSQQGIMKNTGFERYNIRVNNNFKVGKRLEVGLIAQFAPSERKAPSTASFPSGPTRQLGDIIFSAYRRGSVYPIFTSDGQWASVTAWANRFGLASEEGGFQKENFNRFSGSLNLNYKVLEGLTVSGMYGGKYDQIRRLDFSKRMQFISPIDLKTVDFDYNTNSLLVFNQTNYQHNLQVLTNYERTIGDHSLKLLGGFTQEWFEDMHESVGRRDFLTDDIHVISAGGANTQSWTTSGGAFAWAIRSLFGRFNYVLKDKYLFEANLRYDGSSRFAEPVRWGLFPSFSAGWRISEENFMKDNRFVNDLKIRASWGQVGNQNVALYQYASTIGTGAYYFNSQPHTTAFYTGNPNPLLTWETKATANLGVDAGFFSNKLTMSLDVFRDRTNDILLDPPVPDSYGRGRPYQNIGVVDNTGWEVDVRHRNSIRDFSYSIGFQVSDATEKVVDMAGTGPWISGSTITEEGYGMNMWYGWQADGFFQTEEDVKNHSFQNIRTGPGDIRYVEHGGDPNSITADDRIRLGRSNPRFPYGISLEMAWKGFDMAAFGQGVGYRSVYLSSIAGHAFQDQLASAFTHHLDRWTPETPNARFPKTRIGGVNKAFSSFHLQNAAYFRLKNLQVGYTIPTRLSESIKMSRARIYVSVENLLTVTKFIGFDPETPNGSGSSYPLSRVSTLGVNLTF